MSETAGYGVTRCGVRGAGYGVKIRPIRNPVYISLIPLRLLSKAIIFTIYWCTAIRVLAPATYGARKTMYEPR